ncbi:MAG: hypothetical protein OWU32_05830 [Firmicutes bacterium]|nr:hypothetical protein [Bacillota bacterium]
MGDQNHMKKAGQSLDQASRKAQQQVGQGDTAGALGSVLQGATNAATELAKSAADRVSSAIDPDS